MAPLEEEPNNKTNNTHNKILAIVACLSIRFLFAYAAKLASQRQDNLIILRIMAIFATVISIGFMIIFLTGIRQRGFETGGQLIWWNTLRPLHALTYGSFALLVFFGDRFHTTHIAWLALLLDFFIGCLAFGWRLYVL
jgi:hypothetical protein